MSIVPGGPAAKAGLTKGDLIEAFNGARFRFASDRELIEGMTWICAGRPVRLAVRRGDRTREIVIIPRLATTEELRALSRWVEQQKRLEEMVRRQRAEENFEAMVRQAPIDITLRRTAKGFEITSLVLLPQDLDLKNAFVNGLMDALRVGDEVTLRYSWENARNAERIDVILKPSYVDLEVIVERTTHPRERSKP